jgi:hypothetical protein
MAIAAHTGVVKDRPLLLLDVDGVLNPWLMRRLPAGYQHHQIGIFDVILADWHGPAILELCQEASLDLVWATTWEDNANNEIAPRVGLPSDLPWIRFTEDAADLFVETRKLAAVRRSVGDRACVWIDDDLWPDAWAWAAQRTDAGVPTLLVQPHPDEGLVAAHLDQIAKWAAGLERADIAR